MIIKPILTAHMAELQKAFKPRNQTVGASEIGQCARKIWYVKHLAGAISDEEGSFGASHRGKMIEQHTVVPAMRKRFKFDLKYAGAQQQTFISGQSSATPDGMLINQPKDFLGEFGIKDIGKSREVMVEFKSIDPRIRLVVPKPEHERQANQQMGVVRETSKHRPEYCLIVYINASFLDDVIEFVIPYDHERYLKQKERAIMILTAKTAREMKPEGWIKGGKECDYCGFRNACIELRTDVPAKGSRITSQQFIAEIKALAIEERKWNARVSAAEEEQRNIQNEIKTRLRDKNTRMIKEPDVSVNWFPVSARVSYDMDALGEAAAKIKFNIEPFKKIGDPGDRLNISVSDVIKKGAIKQPWDE